MEQVKLINIGLIDYQKAWDFQSQLLAQSIARKKEIKLTPENGLERLHSLILCEHPPVYTLGKSGSLDNLLLSETELADRDISFYPINRGGDITYHGPGQVVGYPVFDLEGFFTDVHRYVRTLEQIVIRVLSNYGIEGERIEGYTGVWLKNPDRKICAIGVHLSRWVSMHGFAFNINTDLNYFEHIIPCGIDEEDKAVTSLEKELGRPIDINEVKDYLATYFKSFFDFEYL